VHCTSCIHRSWVDGNPCDAFRDCVYNTDLMITSNPHAVFYPIRDPGPKLMYTPKLIPGPKSVAYFYNIPHFYVVLQSPPAPYHRFSIQPHPPRRPPLVHSPFKPPSSLPPRHPLPSSPAHNSTRTPPDSPPQAPSHHPSPIPSPQTALQSSVQHSPSPSSYSP